MMWIENRFFSSSAMFIGVFKKIYVGLNYSCRMISFLLTIDYCFLANNHATMAPEMLCHTLKIAPGMMDREGCEVDIGEAAGES